MALLKLQLLGEFRLSDKSGKLLALSSRKAQCLLAYLATRPRLCVSRIELCRLLWEHHDESQAQANLRQCISVVHKLVEPIAPDWLLRNGGQLHLNADEFEIDIEYLDTQIIPGEGDSDLRTSYGNGFLSGLTVPGQQLNDWLHLQRNQFELAFLDYLQCRLTAEIDAALMPEAAETARRLLDLNPMNEVVHCCLMQIFSELGQQHRILRQFQACSEAMENGGLGNVSAETTRLFQKLYHDTSVIPHVEVLSGNHAPEPVTESPANAIPAIAVLPFTTRLARPDPVKIGHALCEEVVHELRRFHGFRVISALSSRSLAGENPDFHNLGHLLGARYLVAGSIRQHQNRIRVSIELVDTVNGELIWAEQYYRALQDLFVLQAEIARDIAGTIEPEMLGHAYLLSTRKTPESLTAWDLVLHGDHNLFMQLGTRFNSNAAQQHYRQAMKIDPDYAPAYAGLAYSQCLELKECIAREPQAVADSMRQLAEHAVRLDENNPWCLVVLGRALQQLQEFDAAVRVYQKAVKLCPSSSKAHFGLGFGLSATGQHDEAIKELDCAIELSPRDPMSWSFHTVKALTHLYAGDFEQAAESSIVSTSYASANHWAPVVLAPSLTHLGRFDEAQRVLDQARRSKPDISIEQVTAAFQTENESDHEAIREGLREAGLTR